MNSAVRILKRGRNEGVKDLKPGQDEKRGQQSTHEIVSTIKGWITELEQRRRDEERTWAALIK